MKPESAISYALRGMEMITLRPLSRPDTMCRKICTALEEKGGLTEHELTVETGLSVASVCKYLKLLCAEEYVRRGGFTMNRHGRSHGKLPRMYWRTAAPLPDTDIGTRPVMLPVDLVAVMNAMVRSAR